MALRILVCDDEPHITRAIRMKLGGAGFAVETARDGQEAWEIIHREPPALVITDYQMPRLDGLSLCRRVRSEPALASLPLVLLTAKGFEIDADALSDELGLTAVVVKPFSPRALLELVRQTLEGVGAGSS